MERISTLAKVTGSVGAGLELETQSCLITVLRGGRRAVMESHSRCDPTAFVFKKLTTKECAVTSSHGLV